MPAITTPKETAELLRAFDAFRGTFVVRCALLLSPLVFVRPGELRKAEWSGVDLDKGEWRYYVTKTKTEHLVSLFQAVPLSLVCHSLVFSFMPSKYFWICTTIVPSIVKAKK